MAGAGTGQGSLPEHLQQEGRIYLTEVDHVSRRDGNPITMATSPGLVETNGVASSSSEEEDTDGQTEDSSSEESTDDDDDDDCDDETILRRAGVKLQLSDLQGMDKAPLTLLTEVGEESEQRVMYRAASILCSHVLRLEPDNQVAKQFLPILEERLQLDKDLPTESSSDEEESGSGQDTSSTDTDNSEDVSETNKTTPTTIHSKHCKFH